MGLKPDSRGSKFRFLSVMAVCIAATGAPKILPADEKLNDGKYVGAKKHHTHEAGEWMLSYRFNRMKWEGNRDGTNNVSVDEVLEKFPVSPLDMRMEMHMFGLMYGVDENWTLMLILPYMKNTMSLINRRGGNFKTRSSGVGDMKLTGSYRLCGLRMEGSDSRCRLSLDVGVSLPTGSTDERGDTPVGNVKLPYPMQLGSGTLDPILGISYIGRPGIWSWGTKAGTTLRFGKNDEGYRLGHKYKVAAWARRNLDGNINASFRFDGEFRGNIRGHDGDLNPAMVPTSRADLRGGKRIDALIGLGALLSGHRLSVEFGWPVYQDLDGPQLEQDYQFTFGWQKML